MGSAGPMCRSVKPKASHSCTPTCESTCVGLCQMQRTRSRCRKAQRPTRRRALMASVKGVSHLSRRDKRRLFYKLQFWLWRKRSERCRFWTVRGRPRGPGTRPRPAHHLGLKSTRKVLMCRLRNGGNSEVRTSAPGSPLDHGDVSRTLRTAASLSTSGDPLAQPGGRLRPEELSHAVRPLQDTDGTASAPSRLQTASSEPHSPALQEPGREKTTSCLSDVDSLTTEVRDFLEGFYRTYGSFIPLHKSDVLRHLKRKFNCDFSDRKNVVLSEVDKYRLEIIKTSAPSYQVVYKKHILTLEDLLTLADDHWLNDQVMNMYGELIMESSHHQVHFLNSFFHRQLMTKGYDGVRRWTKQVDLFSKTLLLVPIHLEVHWCLVTAHFPAKKICLYDSQGHSLQKVARNILKYLMSEAKEKKQAAFEDGWTVSFVEKIPQQTNENDCGVFVLEYSRCLALSRPFQFSQQDIPRIRKRIYKELCDCRLHDLD